jgi:HSP20 family protein
MSEQTGTENSTPSAQAALLPPVDVHEDASGITLHADLPGVAKEGLNLQVEADSLIIDAEITLELPAGTQASHAEVKQPRYRRVFTLSQALDADGISAELRQGVLTLRIPIAAHARPRRIEVQD